MEELLFLSDRENFSTCATPSRPTIVGKLNAVFFTPLKSTCTVETGRMRLSSRTMDSTIREAACAMA